MRGEGGCTGCVCECVCVGVRRTVQWTRIVCIRFVTQRVIASTLFHKKTDTITKNPRAEFQGAQSSPTHLFPTKPPTDTHTIKSHTWAVCGCVDDSTLLRCLVCWWGKTQWDLGMGIKPSFPEALSHGHWLIQKPSLSPSHITTYHWGKITLFSRRIITNFFLKLKLYYCLTDIGMWTPILVERSCQYSQTCLDANPNL